MFVVFWRACYSIRNVPTTEKKEEKKIVLAPGNLKFGMKYVGMGQISIVKR